MSPTERTLAWLRARGWLCAVVERWNPHIRIRQDLWGFCDILACQPLRGIVAIQATAQASNLAKRRAKIEAEPRAKTVLLSGVQVWAIGWSLRGPRGERKLWKPRIEVARVVDEQLAWSPHEESVHA